MMEEWIRPSAWERRSSGAHAVAMIESAAPPFTSDRPSWRPSPDWLVPTLPG
jgi:hypothetical protein